MCFANSHLFIRPVGPGWPMTNANWCMGAATRLSLESTMGYDLHHSFIPMMLTVIWWPEKFAVNKRKCVFSLDEAIYCEAYLVRPAPFHVKAATFCSINYICHLLQLLYTYVPYDSVCPPFRVAMANEFTKALQVEVELEYYNGICGVCGWLKLRCRKIIRYSWTRVQFIKLVTFYYSATSTRK